MEDGTDVGILTFGAQTGAVPSVTVELMLALLDRLVETLEGDDERVRLLVTQPHLRFGQSRHSPTDFRVQILGVDRRLDRVLLLLRRKFGQRAAANKIKSSVIRCATG